MITIEYSSKGLAVPDAEAEDKARSYLKDADKLDSTICISTETFITAVRALICEGVTSHENVRFMFKGEYILPNKDGRLPSWPMGFCDTSEKFLMRLLAPSIERGKQRRGETS